MDMEANPCSPPLRPAAEATTSLEAKEPSASPKKQPSGVDMAPSSAEATPPPPPSRNNRPVDAVTLSAEKKASSGERGGQSTEKDSVEISIPEPSTPIADPSSFYRRDGILLLLLGGGRDVLSVPVPVDCAVLFLMLASVLYALLTPWLLCPAAGDATTFVWTNSLVSISYSLIGTVCLSTETPTGVILRLSGGTLLAVAASHLIGPVTGTAVASLVTFYGAGTLGYSVGEHLQRVGIERSADVVAGRPARNEEQEKRREETIVFGCFVLSVSSLLVVARMVWVVFIPGSSSPFGHDPLTVVEELSLETLLLAWIWSGHVALGLLESAIVSYNTLFGKGLACFFATNALSITFMAAKYDAASLLVMWTVAMAVVGFFGYCLAVYARCEDIKSRIQSVSACSSLSQNGPSEVLAEPDQKPAYSSLLQEELGDDNQKPAGPTDSY